MGKFYWNIRRTHRTSMKFSVALSLTLVFLATVFATPKPKTYLVETADPELDAWSFEDPFYRRAGADYYGKPKPVEYKPVEKYEVEPVEYKSVEKCEAHQLSINQLRNMKLNQLRNMRLHQLSINQLRNTETGSMFCNMIFSCIVMLLYDNK